MHVFWLKIGHWRIMWYVVIIISVKLFSIHWALIYPDLIQGAQDTLQTPSRHPPDTPCWSLFWPKIGHWEKMRYLFKMISTRPFPIDLALIHLRHNPEGPWHPPDTQQTPNWHLTDSLKCMFFWPKTGHCEKSQYMVKWYLQVCFQWIWHQYTSNTTQSVQDTLQTANRHFQTAINTQT